ncbi:hypothetical protein GCM10027280_45200 [Micromonospora polyrhachis]|uniref:Uncharacterized protein n=1 Tax=Micromonospora polyrhachis TaxID=1282883 RepID=A0A7W7WP90_9ACTN|nr:hypothetical protein [Micromonospora polyrhachis]MBB4958966.1 hypothetical protein [Micromonospora polyrhachis]
MTNTDQLAATAVDAVRAMLTARTPHVTTTYHRVEQAAARTVTAAVLAGVNHRTIAERAGCDGLTVIGLIRDTEATTAVLVAERHHAEQYVTAVREATAAHARQVIAASGGRGKSSLARQLKVSRPTLDAWTADS